MLLLLSRLRCVCSLPIGSHASDRNASSRALGLLLALTLGLEGLASAALSCSLHEVNKRVEVETRHGVARASCVLCAQPLQPEPPK